MANEQKKELDAKYNEVCYVVGLFHDFEGLHYFEQPDEQKQEKIDVALKPYTLENFFEMRLL